MSSGSHPRPLRALVLMLLGGAAAYGVNRVLAERQARREAELAPHPFVLRRESLLDISDPEDPRQETVLVAEGLDISDLELDEDIIEEFAEPDPDDRNTTATIAGHEEAFAISEEEMAAHEAAVVAEAERIEHEHAESENRATEAAKQVVDEPAAEAAPAPTLDKPVKDDAPPQPTEGEAVEAAPTPAPKKKGKRKAKRAASSDTAPSAATSPNPAEGDVDDAAKSEGESSKPEPASTDAVAWIPPISGECPLSHPIKARYATGRYHMPNTTSYSKIVADCCYATAAEAEADGFSESRW